MKKTLGCTLAIGLLACGGSHQDGALDEDASVSVTAQTHHASGYVPDAARSTELDGSTSKLGFSVSIEASDVELCSGECTDLKVLDRNRLGVVSYAWEGGLSPSATQHVCPTSTSSYRVAATSTSAAGEFASEQTASDSLTISVRDCSLPKQDEAVLCELRHRFDLPTGSDLASVTKPWASLFDWNGSSAIEATPDGGAYLIGSFSQALDLGAENLQAIAPVSGFLHKMDANCAPVRTQLLRATFPGDLALPTALTVDAQGNVYVALMGGPLLHFNPLVATPVHWATELVIEKFSPLGESLYRVRIPTSLGGVVFSIEVDAVGQLYLSGYAPSVTDLGSGLPIGLSPTGYHSFALVLDAQGGFRAQRIDTGATHIEVAGERVFSLVDNASSLDLLKGLFGPLVDELKPALSGLNRTDLAPLWSVPLPWQQEGSPMAAEGLASGGVAVIFAKSVDSAPGDSWTSDRSLVLKRFDADGVLKSGIVLAQQSAHGVSQADDAGTTANGPNLSALQFRNMREDRHGALLLSGLFWSDVELAGTLLKPPAALDAAGNPSFGSTQGMAVVKVGDGDTIRWVRQQTWGDDTFLRGLSPSPSGDVFVAGEARVPAAPSDSTEQEWDLVVRKLRAD
ncbi:MAG: hypothetical protein JWN04_5644 [Myxococcaceae bacterium]|nr:hypothetical protein [Myxococcaceae bacterium]